MSRSLSQPTNLTCLRCERSFTGNIWLIVDTNERPDLLGCIQAGTLHDLHCPHCNHIGRVDAPILVFRPGGLPALLFSPAAMVTEEQTREHAEGLQGLLHDILGSAWRDEWLEGMLIVPRTSLPAALSEENKYIGIQDYLLSRTIDPQKVQSLADDLITWIQQDTLDAAETYLDQHKTDLLSDEGNFAMTLLIQANPDNPIVRNHQQQLARAREIGVPVMYAEIRQQKLQEKSSAEEKLSLDLLAVLAELTQDDVIINNQEDLEMALAARPDLHAKLIAALSNEPSVQAQFRVDWQKAQVGLQYYSQENDYRKLDEATAAWERILQHHTFSEASDEFQLMVHNDGGSVFLQRYWAKGQLTDLDRALHLWQTAVQHTTFDHPYRTIYLNNLGIGLSARYTHTGHLADLEMAIAAWEDALQNTPPDWPNRAALLTNLSNVLRDRYARTGQLADLETAIAAAHEAVYRTLPNTPARARCLNNLAIGLRIRYTCTGQEADLEAAIIAYQDALHSTPLDSPDRASLLNNLGNSLSDRYALTSQLYDLEMAITAYQEAIQHTSPDSPVRAMYLNNLGLGLHNHYIHTGQLADLEASIIANQNAVQRTPLDSPDRARNLNNLGNSLRARYIRFGQLADLEASISVYREAVQLTPPDSPDLATNLNNLGTGLRAYYAHTGRSLDLEAAIFAYQEAVRHTPPGSPDSAMHYNNLGNGLSDRYARTGQLPDLEAAISATENALQCAPLDSPARAMYLANLANSFRERYACIGHPADLETALIAYEKACRLGQERQISESLRASRSWGNWALTRSAWDEAYRAYQYGLHTLDQLYQNQLLEQEQQSWQREGQGLYAQAAYALARIGDLFDATVTLEQGQARGLNDRLARDEADLSRVQQQSPELFQRYQKAASRLRQLEAIERQEGLSNLGATKPPDWAVHRQQVQQARAELQAVIAAIRQLDGYDHFLLPPNFADVAAAVQLGQPIVYLVSTPVGSLALLLHRLATDTDVTVEHLWADAFTEKDLDDFLLKGEKGEEPDGYLVGQFFGGSVLQAALAEGMLLLGEKLLAPLTQRLQSLGLQRVILIPGGRLNLLPLHAAIVSVNNQPAIFGDLFTVSYAHSARVLATSRHRLKTNEQQSDSLLAVGNPLPLPNGIRPLRFARPEAEEIALRFGPQAQLLCEGEATHTAVSAAIPNTNYLHFACHGEFNIGHPLNSGLVLSAGERLTLRQVLDELTLSGTRLVVLSACQTAISDFYNLPDEVIGLPAGFLQAGAVGVLGSLWPVDDLSTAIFMDHFYHLHRDKGLEPAVSLQLTQQWLRRLTIAELSRLFAAYKANAPDAPPKPGTSAAPDVPVKRMAHALAQAHYTDFTLDPDRQATPYADPFYWAAFAFYGA